MSHQKELLLSKPLLQVSTYGRTIVNEFVEAHQSRIYIGIVGFTRYNYQQNSNYGEQDNGDPSNLLKEPPIVAAIIKGYQNLH